MTTNTLAKPHSSRACTDFVCSLEGAAHAESCGGKASHLGEMIALGINVPPGFVITDRAFQTFLDANQLRSPISNLLAGVQPNQLEAIDAASQAIRGRIMAATIPDSVLAPVREALAETLPGAVLAVRSSAIGEDSRHAAFAGQLDSFLGVDSDDSLRQSLLACWSSYWSQRSLFYQLSRGVQLRGMGVVIQELICSRISGILFTQNPETSRPETSRPETSNHDDDSLLVEYCFGFGDALAAGKLNPGRFVIARHDSRWRKLATPEQDHRDDESYLFNDDQIRCLASAALTLEEQLGCPQDIEWTIDQEGKLYLVQTRPITVDPVATPAVHSHPAGDRTPGPSMVWSNANVNENFPRPISPLLYSIASLGYYHYFRNLGLALGIHPRRAAAMEAPLRNVIGVHGARMYYNLTSIHTLLRMAPCGESLSEWFNTFVGAAQTPNTDDSSSWKSPQRSRWSQLVEACRIVLRTTGHALFVSRRITLFEKTIDDFAATTLPDQLHDKPLSQLLQDLRSFMDIRCNRWTNASLADAAAMVSYGLLKRLLNNEFPDDAQSGLHNALLKGVGDVVSGAPITELWDLSRMVRNDSELRELLASNDTAETLAELRTNERFAAFRVALDESLDNWGFRCSGELMLTVPSIQEQPEALLDMLQAYVNLEGESPPELLQRQASERADETAKVLGILRRRKLLWFVPWPSKATLAAMVLKTCHASIGLRERARLKQALLYSRCRRIVLAIADKLVAMGFLRERNDVFLLTVQELESLLAGSAMFAFQTNELVQLRKSGHEQLSSMAPTDAFVLPMGEYLPVVDPQRPATGGVVGHSSHVELDGVGVCGGQVTAPAAVLSDISEFRLLNEGDVLVTRQTDPGWGPVFFLIKGLVMERGGMLSHGAILAREYGIPTVVGVPHATERISPGQIVNLNGDRGIVYLAD